MRTLFTLLAIGLFISNQAVASESIDYDSEQKALDYMALSYASLNGHIILVEGLLARGAPVNPPTTLPDPFTGAEYLSMQFVTPLQAASDAGHLDVVMALLEKKPLLEWQCCSGGTALHFAASKGHLEIVEALLNAGADANAYPSPLAAAKKGGYQEVVEILRKATESPK